MKKRPKRARTERRQADRDASKLLRDVRKVFAFEPGGAPDRAIVVVSPSQIESDAASRACPACGGRVVAQSHEVIEHQGERLRTVEAVCTECRERWRRYYRLGAALN